MEFSYWHGKRDHIMATTTKRIAKINFSQFPFNNENSNPKNIDRLKNFNYLLLL